jgi:NAD(P)-dependent dehydrogenase (short-subunit alcohol dehydrogenase family)
MSKLKGKVAVVTGGNSGIGLATAKLFKEEGAKVVITARSAETYRQAQAEYGSQFDIVQADVSKLADIDKLIQHVKTQYGTIDSLFVNAGIAEPSPTEQVTEEHFDRQFNVNVKGLYFTVQKALPLMKPGSAVVLNASVVATKGFPGISVYSATKAAVRSLARTWAAELSAKGIRVNVLSPGPIDTPIHAKMGVAKENRAEYEENMAKSVPLGRFGKPEEMAKAALFLASDDSSYMTGADLVADGGIGQV